MPFIWQRCVNPLLPAGGQAYPASVAQFHSIRMGLHRVDTGEDGRWEEKEEEEEEEEPRGEGGKWENSF